MDTQKEKNLLRKRAFKRAFIDSIPVLTGYIPLGIGFGVLLASKGYSALWAGFMSLIIYGGSLQYVSVNLLSTAASIGAVLIVSMMLNARQFFYGLSLLDKYRDLGKRKPYCIFAVTDETYSVVLMDTIKDTPIDAKQYYFYLSILDHMYWIIGSVLGGLIGMLIPFNTTGIDFAMTALFVVILVEQWLSAKSHFPAILGICSAAACLLIFGSENFMVPSLICITAVLLGRRRKLEEVLEND